MHLGKSSEDLSQLQECSARGNLQSEHLAQHCDADLEANPGEKADEHRLGEKVSDEAELQ